jgi:hypothetical protein
MGSGRAEVDLPPPDKDLTIQIQPKVAITVRVLDAAGRPVPGACIDHAFSQGDKHWLSGTQQADGSGLLRLDVFPGTLKLDVRDGVAGGAREELQVAAGVGREIEVRLDPKGTIRGQVLDRDGRPVEGIRVSIRGGKQEESTAEFGVPGMRSVLLTDRSGRFAAMVPDGVYTVVVRPDVEPSAAPVPGVRPGGPIITVSLEGR